MKKPIALISAVVCSWSATAQLTELMDMPGGQSSSYSDEELLKTWGWLLAERFNLGSFEFTEAEMRSIAEGMTAHVEGKDAPTELEESLSVMQEYFASREQRVMERQLTENRAKEEAFFEELFGVPGIQSLGSGLHYEILREGEGEKPSGSDFVVARYEGRFLDNKVFDSTEGGPPAQFNLDEVIPGWKQGLQLIGEGGKIKLYIPAKLGYGDQGPSGIPPGATLVFEVELLKVGLPENAAEAAPDGEAPPAMPADAGSDE